MNARALKAQFSSATPEYATPWSFFRDVNARFRFTLDVCATSRNAKCARYFSRKDDALTQRWTGVCWMNPPYGREIGRWVAKARASAQQGATVVCLLPSRTDTAWWHEHVEPVLRGRAPGAVTFLRGRLKFGASENSAPFPSVLVVYLPVVASPDATRLAREGAEVREDLERRVRPMRSVEGGDE